MFFYYRFRWRRTERPGQSSSCTRKTSTSNSRSVVPVKVSGQGQGQWVKVKFSRLRTVGHVKVSGLRSRSVCQCHSYRDFKSLFDHKSRFIEMKMPWLVEVFLAQGENLVFFPF